MKRALCIPVPTLKQGQNRIEFALQPRDLDFAPREVSENPSFELLVGPVQISAVVVRSGRRLLVTGTVRFRARLECALCGTGFESDFDEPLSAEFAEAPADGAEGEPDEDDADRLPLRGDCLDLKSLVHDAIHLAVPIAPVCQPDCKGLCPECGADLNRTTCHCRVKRPTRAARD